VPEPDAILEPRPKRSWPRRLLNRAEINQAVFFALLLRGWQLAGGAVSVLLITYFFTREVQGYYYTFSSLLALQTFFELGMHLVIISAASHEWSQLNLNERGEIVGDTAALSRLISLGRSIALWYTIIAVAFVAIVGVVGVTFFALKPSAAVAWLAPWIVLVLLSGSLLWTLPLNALLEGCNQVNRVHRFRFIQTVCANLVVWTAIASGAGLWAAVAATAARLVCELFFLGWRYRRFFQVFRQVPTGPRVHWWSDIWPMQWRIAISGAFSYFQFFLYTPVMFYYHGAVVAGQMGMTWTLITALEAAALAWVQTRVPLFGILIAKRDYGELDRVFFRLTWISLSALALAGVAAWGLVCGLYWAHDTFSWWGFRLAERVLPPLPTAIFFLAVILYQVPRCQDFYLRAHKREPLWLVNASSCILIGMLVWLLGARFGPTGAASGYAAAVALFVLPAKTIIWMRCRRQWHQA
jgi:hypothetical protein